MPDSSWLMASSTTSSRRARDGWALLRTVELERSDAICHGDGTSSLSIVRWHGYDSCSWRLLRLFLHLSVQMFRNRTRPFLSTDVRFDRLSVDPAGSLLVCLPGSVSGGVPTEVAVEPAVDGVDCCGVKDLTCSADFSNGTCWPQVVHFRSMSRGPSAILVSSLFDPPLTAVVEMFSRSSDIATNEGRGVNAGVTRYGVWPAEAWNEGVSDSPAWGLVYPVGVLEKRARREEEMLFVLSGMSVCLEKLVIVVEDIVRVRSFVLPA